MAYKGHPKDFERRVQHVQYSPTIYEKVGNSVILSTNYPKSNLKPDDFEIDNLLLAGVNTDSKVKFEENTTIDRIDTVLGRVIDANIVLDEKEKSNSNSD